MKLELVEILNTDQITVAEVKRTLRVTGDGHNTEIESILDSAREWVEKTIDTTIGEKVWTWTSDEEYTEYTLPRGPVIEIQEEEDYTYTYQAGFSGGVIPADVKRLILLVCKRLYDLDDLGEENNNEIKRLILANTRNPKF